MKKLLVLLCAALFLAACGNPSTEKTGEKKETAAAEKDNNKTVLRHLGTVNIQKNIDVNKKFKYGPLDIEITNVKTAKIKVDESALGLVDDKKEIYAVALQWTIKNTSKNITEFNELANYIVTNDKQQIHGTTFDGPTSIDYELHPGVKQNGELYFVMDKDVKDLKSFDFYLDEVRQGDKTIAKNKKVLIELK